MTDRKDKDGLSFDEMMKLANLVADWNVICSATSSDISAFFGFVRTGLLNVSFRVQVYASTDETRNIDFRSADIEVDGLYRQEPIICDRIENYYNKYDIINIGKISVTKAKNKETFEKLRILYKSIERKYQQKIAARKKELTKTAKALVSK